MWIVLLIEIIDMQILENYNIEIQKKSVEVR